MSRPARHIVAVASGKGGVGKSTVSLNVALALAQRGRRVGLLDGDFYGPDIPLMVNITRHQPLPRWDFWRRGGAPTLEPVERYGIKIMSVGFLLAERQAMIMPAVFTELVGRQLVHDVDWGELDYLVIDLPPGTSDAQLTLAQAVPISGTLLVTTPQDVALLDVQKAMAMFRRMSVPIMGVVENMSAFVCAHCGEATEIFGRGGGEKFARQHGIEYFGGIPLDIKVRQGSDVGVPAVAQREPGAAAEVMRSLARTVAARMSVRAARESPVLSIS